MDVRGRNKRALADALRRWARSGRPRAGQSGERVVFVLVHAWGMGGTIRSTLSLAERLAERHEVEILSLVRRRDEPFFAFPPGVTVTAVDDQRGSAASPLARLLRRYPSALVPSSDHARNALTLWTDVCLARRLRGTRPAVMLGTRPGLNVLVADMAPPGAARIGHEHMHFDAHPPSLQALIRDRYGDLDTLIVLTDADRRRYEELLGGETRVVRIANAARVLGGRRPELVNSTLLAAGRLTPQKGFDTLIDAFSQITAQHPGWRLRICGGGPRRRSLQRRIDDLGLGARITLAGPVAELGDEMAEASVFVLSSRFEGFPLALVEAMRKGLPVIAFDCPTGPGEVIDDHRNGLLVPAEDVGALAGALREMIEDPELRRRCAAAGEATAAAYDIDVIGPQWEALLGGLVGSRSAPVSAPRAPRPRTASGSISS